MNKTSAGLPFDLDLLYTIIIIAIFCTGICHLYFTVLTSEVKGDAIV